MAEPRVLSGSRPFGCEIVCLDKKKNSHHQQFTQLAIYSKHRFFLKPVTKPSVTFGGKNLPKTHPRENPIRPSHQDDLKPHLVLLRKRLVLKVVPIA